MPQAEGTTEFKADGPALANPHAINPAYNVWARLPGAFLSIANSSHYWHFSLVARLAGLFPGLWTHLMARGDEARKRIAERNGVMIASLSFTTIHFPETIPVELASSF